MIYLLPHTIHNSANRFPDKEAFRCGNRSISYADLVKQTSQLANLLIDLGVKKGDRVGLYLNRSLETCIVIYGIMKAGAAYVPLNPTAPASRNCSQLTDCGIEHLISHQSQTRAIQQIVAQKVALKSIIGIDSTRLDLSQNPAIKCFPWTVLDELSDKNPTVRVLEHDLAYILYTSGSTGTPKGIMHTHHSGLNYAKLSADLYQLNEKDRVANHAPLYFDISTFAYFAAPLAGSTAVIVPDAHTKMPASLSQLIANEKITVWYSVPLALVQMLQRGVLEERDMSNLRWVLYAGEPFPTKHLRHLMLQWPHSRFSNIYGPTEVNQCTYYHLPGPPENDDPIPLGYVWNNTEMLIVDANDRATPEGEIGELLIRSGTNMKGYWKQEERTKKAFYQHSPAPEFNASFYRTGDLVQISEDGLLLFQGRKDRQIKTRGYRVELDEVETHLIAFPSVEEAAVISIEMDDNLAIMAAVVLKENSTTTEKELKEFLAKHLPWYAIPQQIHIKLSFPRTSTGKINRTDLLEQISSTVNS